MVVLSLEERRANKVSKQSSKENQEESDCKNLRNTSNPIIQFSSQSSKVIHFNKFQLHRQVVKWENVKLRNGLSIKIHLLRKEIEAELELKYVNLQNREKLSEELLELASEYSDSILHSDSQTMQLLNKYAEFKDVLNLKVKQYL